MKRLVPSILIAAPNLPDSSPQRKAVIYLFSGSDRIFLGMNISTSISFDYKTYFAHQLGIQSPEVLKPIPIYDGGPHEPDNLFLIEHYHVFDRQTARIRSLTLFDRTREELLTPLSKKPNKPFLLSMGITAWSTEQLAEDLILDKFKIIPANQNILYNWNRDTLWEECRSFYFTLPNGRPYFYKKERFAEMPTPTLQ